MRHVRLLVMTDDLSQAALTLAETGRFHPDPRPPVEAMAAGIPGSDYRARYQQARGRLEKIARLVPVESTPPLATLRVVQYEELVAVDAQLGQCWAEVSQFEEQFRHLDEGMRVLRDQQAALENFANLDIDLGALRNKTRFLDFYVGMVPRENVSRIEGALRLAGYLLFEFLHRGDSSHVVIVGPRAPKAGQIEAVLRSASFQALPIPAGRDDADPAQQQQDLARRLVDLEQERAAAAAALEDWAATHGPALLAARRTLLLAEPLVTLDPSIRSAGPLAMLSGWVPAGACADLEQRLDAALGQPFAMQTRDPLPAERPLVPTVAVRNRYLEPFGLLVRQYGIPGYGEVDPTPLFALTFLIMFGAMFGDLGQGAVIAGVAWGLRRRFPHVYRFGILAGIASMLFGLLYGSLFGYEEVLPALWRSPIHHPILMLQLALGFGVLFLVSASLLAIYNRVLVGNYAGALFDHHGLVSLAFYGAMLRGGLNLAAGAGFGLWPLLLVLGTLLLLAITAWRHLQAPLGERLLVVCIETLETIIGYISNTLSFLRVAAFSLNHAALSMAVLTLANMMGSAGHVLTVILGNLFVLVLEGGIVMIQVMRLEYYEGFSRYFSGEGHAFAPLRLQRGRLATAGN
ncbi:MAG: ATPase [Chromatiaceae bacterium]|nr:MAG: ATPase [Chromatiaceae bacterium]